VMRTLSSDSETGDEEPRRIVRRPRSALVIPSSSELGQISPEVTLPVPARNVIRFPAARRGLDAGSSREPRRDRVLSAETIGRPSRRTPATGGRRSVVDLDTPDPIDADGDEDVQIVADSGAALRNRRSRPRRAVEPVLISDSEPESLTDSLRSGNTTRSGASVPVVLDDSDDDAVIFASDSDFLPRTRADPPTRMQTLPRRSALSRSFAPAGNLSDDSRTGARNSRTRPPVPMGMDPNSASAERLRQLRQGRMRAPLVENNGVVLVDSDEGELDADLASIRSTVDTRGRDTRRTSTRQSTLDRSTRRPGLSTASSARAQASAGARESDEELALRLQNEEFAAPRFGVGRTTAATFPQAPGDLLPSANRRRGGLSFADVSIVRAPALFPSIYFSFLFSSGTLTKTKSLQLDGAGVAVHLELVQGARPVQCSLTCRFPSRLRRKPSATGSVDSFLSAFSTIPTISPAIPPTTCRMELSTLLRTSRCSPYRNVLALRFRVRSTGRRWTRYRSANGKRKRYSARSAWTTLKTMVILSLLCPSAIMLSTTRASGHGSRKATQLAPCESLLAASGFF